MTSCLVVIFVLVAMSLVQATSGGRVGPFTRIGLFRTPARNVVEALSASLNPFLSAAKRYLLHLRIEKTPPAFNMYLLSSRDL